MKNLQNIIILFFLMIFMSGCAGFKNWLDSFEEKPEVIKKKVVIPHSPKKAKKHHEMGRALVLKGEFKESIRHFKKATKFDKNVVEYHYDLAVAYTSVRSTSPAGLRSFKKVIQLSSKGKKKYKEVYYSYYGMASIYALSGKKTLAVDALVNSVKTGFSHYKMLRSDGDFRSLKGFKRFDDFIKTLK